MKPFVLLTILAIGTHMCFAQDDSSRKDPEPIKFTPPSMYSPLYVLEVDEQTWELDPRKNERLDLESFDSQWIKSINVMSGEDAKNKYGEKALHGAVVIMFKDYYILPKELQTKFKLVN